MNLVQGGDGCPRFFNTLIMKNTLLYIFFFAIIITPVFITIETENDSELIEYFTGFVSFTICAGVILRNVFAINKYCIFVL